MSEYGEYQCIVCKQYFDRRLLHKRTVEMDANDPDSEKVWFVCADCFPGDSAGEFSEDLGGYFNE